MTHPNETTPAAWQYTYHRIKDSKFFWGLVVLLCALAGWLAVEYAVTDDGFDGRKIPLTVFGVLTAITLLAYCVTTHYNGVKKVYHYTLAKGVVSYKVPSHPITKKQTGNSEYLRQYFKSRSFGVGEKGSYRLSPSTQITPHKRAGRIALSGPDGRFTVRAGQDDFDAVLTLLRQSCESAPTNANEKR